jgi:hypothetical protein
MFSERRITNSVVSSEDSLDSQDTNSEPMLTHLKVFWCLHFDSFR